MVTSVISISVLLLASCLHAWVVWVCLHLSNPNEAGSWGIRLGGILGCPVVLV